MAKRYFKTKKGQWKQDRRADQDENPVPSWAYQMQSDIRDIKTRLDLKLEPFEDICNKARIAYDLAMAHEKQRISVQNVIWVLIIGAIGTLILK